MAEGWGDWLRAWEDAKIAVEECRDAGEHVVSVSTVRAKGRASGLEVEWPDRVAVWTVRDGKIVRVVWFPTRAEALEAVALRG